MTTHGQAWLYLGVALVLRRLSDGYPTAEREQRVEAGAERLIAAIGTVAAVPVVLVPRPPR